MQETTTLHVTSTFCNCTAGKNCDIQNIKIKRKNCQEVIACTKSKNFLEPEIWKKSCSLVSEKTRKVPGALTPPLFSFPSFLRWQELPLSTQRPHRLHHQAQLWVCPLIGQQMDTCSRPQLVERQWSNLEVLGSNPTAVKDFSLILVLISNFLFKGL